MILRLERPEDYRTVEELTRDAFWKNSRHMCDEHLLVNRLRNVSSFVKELDYVAEMNGKIVGHIIYTKSKVEDGSGKGYELLTFGPLSVSPEYQNTGIGKALMLKTFEEARKLRYRAVIILGHPDYYPRVGFRPASEFGITTADGKNFDAFMALPLYPGALDGITGRFFFDPVYDNLDEEDVLEFENTFPHKEPFVPLSVSLLLAHLKLEARIAIEGLRIKHLDVMSHKSEAELSALPGMDAQSIDIVRKVLAEYGYRWGR